MMKKKLKAISLFSSAGIGELLFNNSTIDVVLANEIIKNRALCYQFLHPNTPILIGDIQESNIKEKIIKTAIDNDVKLLIATPPCQGLSTLGKNKNQEHFIKDKRNYLIFNTFEIIDKLDFDYILIENVPRFLDMFFPYKGDFSKLDEIIKDKYLAKYNIEINILNAKDYGVSQLRPRAIIRMYKKHLKWPLPKKEKEVPLKKVISHLPSLESGQSSKIKWHCAKVHNDRALLALKYTPTGASALLNPVHFPKKETGERIKGFHNTFKRMSWDAPAPARTTYCGSISSHNNVHPGRLLKDGTYSDARALSLLETFIVHSMPIDVDFPDWASDTFVRTMIGESIPPLMLYKILNKILEG